MNLSPAELGSRIRKHFQAVLEEDTTPHAVGLGFALGTLLAVLPTFGFAIVIGLGIIALSEHLNKLAMFAGMAVFNPLTTPFLYLASYRIGQLIFGSEPVVKYNIVIIDNAYNFTRRFLIGNILIAITLSATGYFLLRHLVNRYQKNNS